MLLLSELPSGDTLTLAILAYTDARVPLRIAVHYLHRRSRKQGLSVPAGWGLGPAQDADPGGWRERQAFGLAPWAVRL
jgi:hypothetical protein